MWKWKKKRVQWHIVHTLFPAFGLSTVSPIGNASPFGIRYGPSDLLRRDGVPRSSDWNINRNFLFFLFIFSFVNLFAAKFNELQNGNNISVRQQTNSHQLSHIWTLTNCSVNCIEFEIWIINETYTSSAVVRAPVRIIFRFRIVS